MVAGRCEQTLRRDEISTVTAGSELLKLGDDPLEPPSFDGDDLEAAIERPALGMAGEPDLGRAPEATTFLRRHHLERVTVGSARLSLHLAEDEPAAAAKDQVELVAARPDVGSEHAIAAQPVVAPGAALEPLARPPRARPACVQAATIGAGSSAR